MKYMQEMRLRDIIFFTFISIIQTDNSFETDYIAINAAEEFKELCPYTELCYTGANATLGERLSGGSDVTYPCCWHCSCEPECGTNCCPDKLAQFLSKEEIQKEKNKLEVCVYAQFRDYYKNGLNGASYTMISRCPQKFLDFEIKRRCERSYQDFDFSENPWKWLPVTSLKLRLTFKNYYCFKCYGVYDNDIRIWNAKVTCAHNSVLILQTFSEIPQKLSESPHCQIFFSEPYFETFYTEQCHAIISRCNVTDRWRSYSFELESMCMSYMSQYKGYKNVHCFLCNGHNVADIEDFCFETYPQVDQDSFIALLDFNNLERLDDEGQEDKISLCEESERYDALFDKCRELKCPPGLSVCGTTCVPVFKSVPFADNGLVFSVSYDLIPTEMALSFSERGIENLGYAILDDIFPKQNWIQTDMHFCSIQFFIKINESLENMVSHLMTSNRIAGIMPFVKHITVTVDMTVLSTTDIAATVDEIARFFTANSHFAHFYIRYTAEKTSFPFDGEPISADYLLHLYEKVDNVILSMLNGSRTDPSDSLGVLPFPNFSPDTLCETFILVQPQPFCARVELNSQEFTIDELTQNVTPKIPQNNISENTHLLFSTMISNSDNGGLVCSDEYFQQIQRIAAYLAKKTSIEETHDDHVILSLLCLAVSMVSLLITLIIYCLFSRLRTIPGLNNMGLAISLLVTHCLTFLNSVTDISLHWLCSMIGIILHFALLSGFFWMFICTYYMMRVFLTIKDRSSPTQPGRKFLKYCVIVELTSAILVTANIIVNILKNGSNDTGYSGSPCYIRDPDMIIYFVAIPLGVVLASNFSMYISVVVSVSRSVDMAKSSTAERHNLVIFLKLSTITGLTWAFAFLYQFTKLILFAYANIVFNGGQGLFIMMSFVMNKRVLGMIRNLKSQEGTCSRYVTDGSQPDRHTRETVLPNANGKHNNMSNTTKF